MTTSSKDQSACRQLCLTFGTGILVVLSAWVAVLSHEYKALYHRAEGSLPGGRKYQVIVTEARYRGDGTDFWGTDGERPKFVVSGIHFELDDQLVAMPVECFEDLAEVRYDSHLAVQQDGDHVRLIIHGGDAAGSYYAKYLFEDRILKERVVSHGEVAERISEVTQWSPDGRIRSRSKRNDYVPSKESKQTGTLVE